MPPSPLPLAARLLSLGRRVTSSGNFIPEIDGLRFIAIAWVLAHHIGNEFIKLEGARYPGQIAGSQLVSWLETLRFGVQLFFVISGFILGMPFIRHYYQGENRPSLRNYYIRRVSRIEPPFIINLTLLLILLLVTKSQLPSTALPHFLASIGYVHNLAYQQMSTINFVTWTLEIEAQFYILAPFLVMIFALPARYRGATVAALIAGSSLFAWFATAEWPLMNLTLLGQAQYFLAGHPARGVVLPPGASTPKGRWTGDAGAIAAGRSWRSCSSSAPLGTRPCCPSW